MSKRIAIFGATGAVGCALPIHMLKGNVLRPGDEIVLVGRETEASRAHLLAIRTDLMDAFDDGIIAVSICPTLQELETDVFIMAAGATVSPERRNRRDLAEVNLDLFEDVARALAVRNPLAFVFLISNPVELAVSVFARHLDPRRVIGIGAQQDSLRFARAIANRLGVHRSIVRASVLGEHGEWMLPIWSSVYLTDSDKELAGKLASLRDKYAERTATESLTRTQKEITRLVQEAHIEEAYQSLRCVAPEVRIMVEPLITVNALHSTPNATANATVSCLDALLSADERKIHGQVLLQGEFYGLEGVCGVPICLRATGWCIAAGSQSLSELEIERLRRACRAIQAANENAENIPV